MTTLLVYALLFFAWWPAILAATMVTLTLIILFWLWRC